MNALAAAGTLFIKALNVLIKYFVYDIAFHMAASHAIPVRDRRRYWMQFLLAHAVGIFIVTNSATAPIILQLAWFTLDYMIIPYVNWVAPRGTRIAGVAMLVAGEFVIEAVATIWYAAMGMPLSVQGSSDPRETVIRIGGMALLAALMRIIQLVFARTRAADGAHRKPSAQVSAVHEPGGVRRFSWFFIPQVCLVAMLLLALINWNTMRVSVPVTLLMLGAAVPCMAADIMAVFSLYRFFAASRARTRARALDDRLAVDLDAARSMQTEAEHAARFRHDQRNHLQTLGSLIDAGEIGRARAYVAELRERLRG